LFCREATVQFTYRGIEPNSDEEAIANMVRAIAVDIEGAWGYGGPGNAPRCYIHSQDKHNGAFDEAAFSNLMR